MQTKNSTRFKVGDEVLNITSGLESYWNTKMPLHTKGVITDIGDNGRLIIEFDFRSHARQVCDPPFYRELEHALVYDSPLNQALK